MLFQVQILCGFWPECPLVGLAHATGARLSASRCPGGVAHRAATATLQPWVGAFPRGQGRGELRPAVGLPGGCPGQEPSGQTCCVNVSGPGACF